LNVPGCPSGGPRLNRATPARFLRKPAASADGGLRKKREQVFLVRFLFLYPNLLAPTGAGSPTTGVATSAAAGLSRRL
jgi:hypothetical protein